MSKILLRVFVWKFRMYGCLFFQIFSTQYPYPVPMSVLLEDEMGNA